MFETARITKPSAAMPHAQFFQSSLLRAFAWLFSCFLPPSLCWADDQAKRSLSLIDCIGGDYQNAVQAEKVINRDQYQQRSEFAALSLELFDQRR